MKKLFISMSLVALLAVGVSAVSAAKPEQTKGPHAKTTGEFTASVGAVTLQMKFNAHDTDLTKGQVMYSASNGSNFTGEVTECYNEDGDRSSFVGMVTGGNFPASQDYFKVEAWDQGEGELAPGADRVRVRLFTSEPDCSIGSVFPAEVTEGNIQVH